MKTLTTQVLYFLRQRPSRMNIANLLRFLVVLALLITTYSVLFHVIMEWEGRNYSWVTGFYWTMTVMSTLGLGDITFQSDLGKVFSIAVMISGVLFLLILFPFTFIEFFYAPWLKAQAEARTPTELPKDTRGHVILTHFDAVVRALIRRLQQFEHPYALLVSDMAQATELYDQGYRVVIGDLDSPQTYQRLRAENALMIATTADDRVNTNVAATVREVAETVPIIATANSPASVDILELAGCTHVLQVAEMLGQALARRILGGETMAHIIGQIDQLQVAEALVTGTSLVGQTVAEAQLRERAGISVLGIWERGQFHASQPETPLHDGTVLVMAGTGAQIQCYNELFHQPQAANGPVLIIGGGRVGRAAARALAERGMVYRVVERASENLRDPATDVLGDAADLGVLKKAGIMETSGVIVTTHDDDTNIYLTIYCRRLRGDVQIVSRAVRERNVATMHRAGANFVMSYASLGATAIINLIDRGDILMVAEGLDVFRLPVPSTLAGKSIAQAAVRRQTGCTVIGLRSNGEAQINPDPHAPLPVRAELLLIGTQEAARRFQKIYGGL
jgi:Trk K+ transport system NAD-binding subunit